MSSAAALAWCVAGLLAASCSARVMRQPLGIMQDRPLVVSFADLKPTLASIWIPSITPSQQKLQVPVAGLPGTPLQTDEMSRLTYTVTYKRRPAYILQGSISVQMNPAFAGTGFSTPAMQIQQPLITLNQAGRTEQLPGGKVRCDSFMVADSSAVNCQFSARIFAESLPPAGTAQALIQIPGRGTHVQTPPMQYDFTSVLPPNARFASTGQSTQYLLDTMGKTPPTAVVTNYFEQGSNLVLPSGVAGTQPAANSILQDSQTFTYTALFKEMPREMCGKSLQVMSSATIQSTSDGAQQPETATSTVDIELLGCDATFQSNPPASGGSGCNGALAGTPIPAAPVPAAPAPAADYVPPPAMTRFPPAARAAVPAPAAAAAALPAGKQQELADIPPFIPPQQEHHMHIRHVTSRREKARSSRSSSSRVAASQAAANRTVQDGHVAVVRRILADDAVAQSVFMAASGSVLCGRNVCASSERCIDDMVCCGFGEKRCGIQCCGAGNVCMNGNMCMPAGSMVCGATACTPSQQCLSGRCCDASSATCGGTCCDSAAGETCVSNQCVARGSSACGSKVCGPDQACVAPGVCCSAGQSACGGQCCSGTCLNGQCTAAGSALCAGSLVCSPGNVCVQGAVCCPVGASYCAGQCCSSGNTCQQGRCLPYGQVPCGGNVCNQDQTCQGNLCCNRGERACGNGCCNTAAGMQCMMGRCMPFGTQPCGTTTCPIGTVCGDPMRSLCCAAGTRACNGNCCGRDQTCSWQRQQCVPINSEAGRQSLQSYDSYGHDPALDNQRDQLYAAMNGGGYPAYGRRHT